MCLNQPHLPKEGKKLFLSECCADLMLQIKAFNNPLVECTSTLAASDRLIAPRQPFIFYGCFLLFSLTGRLKPHSCCLSVNDRKTPWTGHLSLQGDHNNKHIMIHTVGSSDPVSSSISTLTSIYCRTELFSYYCHLDMIKSLKAAAFWNTERAEKSEIRTPFYLTGHNDPEEKL